MTKGKVGSKHRPRKSVYSFYKEGYFTYEKELEAIKVSYKDKVAFNATLQSRLAKQRIFISRLVQALGEVTRLMMETEGMR